MELATRKVARQISIAGSATQRFIFGPFLPGERLESVTVCLASNVAVPAPGEVFAISARAFNDPPPDTTAAFNANGRPLTGVTAAAADQPRLPLLGSILAATAVIGFQGKLPVGFEGSERERFVGFEITELNTDTLLGSIWAEIESGYSE